MIASVTVDPQGLLVALHRDGTISRQVRVDGSAGTYPTAWREVPTDGIDGRVAQVVAQDAILIVLTAAGELWEQYREYSDPSGTYPRWHRVEG